MIKISMPLKFQEMEKKLMISDFFILLCKYKTKLFTLKF